MASPHIAGLAAYMLSTEWAKSAAIADAQELLESTPGYKQLFFGTRNAPTPKEPVVSPKTLKNAMIKVGTKGALTVSLSLFYFAFFVQQAHKLFILIGRRSWIPQHSLLQQLHLLGTPRVDSFPPQHHGISARRILPRGTPRRT